MAKYKSRLLGIGLKVKLTIPKFAMPSLEVMDNQSVGNVVREAMRSAGRPAVTALKSLLQTELIESEQSTGATERAVAMKYGRSKKNPRIFYVVIGVNTTHFEYHTSTIPEGQITKLRRGRKQRGAGLYGMQTRTLKNKTTRSKQVFSRYRYKGKGRTSVSRNVPFKRIPRKYFHLIDKGFDHRRGIRAKAYNFIERLRSSLGGTMQSVFEERLRNLIVPVIVKELKRKWKDVLK